MGTFTLADIREILYFFAVKFDKFSTSSRTIFSICYMTIMITAALLNGTLLYIFITKPATRKPSNLVVSALLWKNIFLLLTALPVTLLELCIKVVRNNHHLVAVQHYVTLFYIWLSFYSVIHIGLNRVRIFKNKVVNTNRCDYRNRYSLMSFIGGITGSALMPITTIVMYHYYGMKVSTIFQFAKLFVMTLVLMLSYGFIIHSVKKSNRMWKTHNNSQLSYQNKTTLKKLKRTVHLVIGGYALTLIPFICSCAVETYLYYERDSLGDNSLFLYTFRAVAETILYLNIIFNPMIYFYTQPDFKEEVAKLKFVNQLRFGLKRLRNSKISEGSTSQLLTIKKLIL